MANNKYVFKVLISVEVLTELSKEEAIEELNNNCLYEIPSVDNVMVTGTEWLEIK